jgi:hypothetical protein
MEEVSNLDIESRAAHIEPAPVKKSIFEILQKRYSSNEYALMREVRDMAGHYASRSADYIAVNLWPSRGLAINGIEVKSFRSDWLSELKKPEKAQNIFQYCDYFWLLTENDSVAKMEEIPSSWGWMSIKGERIFVKKEAPKLEPIAVTKNFLCAMLKRACDRTDFVHVDAIQDKIKEARESEKENNKYKLERAEKERDDYAKVLSEFRKASGINLGFDRWDNEQPRKLGEAVKFIQNGGTESLKSELLRLEETAKKVLNKIGEGLISIK